MKQYRVVSENGSQTTVFAENELQAKERYWDALEGMFGHDEGCCDCFIHRRPFPREKYSQPISVMEIPREVSDENINSR